MSGSINDNGRPIVKTLARSSLQACALFGLALVALSTPDLHAQSPGFTAPSISWVDWTAATTGSPGGSASGFMTIGSTTVNVSYSGDVFNTTQTNGSGTDYYIPISTYTSTIVPNPPLSGMLAVVGGDATVDTITFSQPVTNPFMAIVSQGSPGINVDFTFSHPFNILGTGPGWWGSGAPLTQTSNILHGTESDGIIQFIGTLSAISWTVSGGDTYYNGFTFGVANSPAPQITSVLGGNVLLYEGAPWSFTASGSGGAPLTLQWSLDGANLTNQTRVFGAQSNILTFTSVVVSDTGTYQLAVSNSFGAATTSVTLTVLPDNSYNTFNAYAEGITNTSNLLGYWRFDPTFRFNSCVNGYTGTPQGNASIGAAGSGCPLYLDPENQSLLLDGSSSYLGTSLTGQIGNQGTLMAWVYLTPNRQPQDTSFQSSTNRRAAMTLTCKSRPTTTPGFTLARWRSMTRRCP